MFEHDYSIVAVTLCGGCDDGDEPVPVALISIYWFCVFEPLSRLNTESTTASVPLNNPCSAYGVCVCVCARALPGHQSLMLSSVVCARV